MVTTQANPQERIARELLTQGRPLFVGVDGKGAAHYWDSYEFAVAIVPLAPVYHEPVLPGFDFVVRALGVRFEKVIGFVEGFL